MRQKSMKEENPIESACKRNPFRVPDGYFESLSDQILAKVDAEGLQHERQEVRKAKTVWLRPLLYAAAGVCALFVSVLSYQSFGGDSPVSSSPVVQTTSYQMSDESFDAAADYMMVDNQDIYACLTSEY